MHDIIVVGASAGGVETARELLRQLPADLPAAVFVVIHLHARSRSYLPEILSRASKMPAAHPANGEPVVNGRIFVAPPDHHMIVERGHVRLGLGPKEQHQRPCINVTMRSAAQAYQDRVAGVVLTGTLDDGTAGLWEIKRKGGVAVVQRPEEALFPSMPLSALREIEVDYTVPLAEMGDLLTRLAKGEGATRRTQVERPPMEPMLTDLTLSRLPRHDLGSAARPRQRVPLPCRPRPSRPRACWRSITLPRRRPYMRRSWPSRRALAGRLADRLDADLAEPLRREARDRQSEAESLRELLRDRQPFSVD